jgi:hypothetical protein
VHLVHKLFININGSWEYSPGCRKLQSQSDALPITNRRFDFLLLRILSHKSVSCNASTAASRSSSRSASGSCAFQAASRSHGMVLYLPWLLVPSFGLWNVQTHYEFANVLKA